MKRKQSQWGLALFGIGATALFSGCVIKTTDNSGTGGATGSSSSSGSTTSATGSGTTSATGSTSGSATVTGSTTVGAGGASTTSSGAGGSSGGSSGGSGTGGWMDSGVYSDASGDAWQDGGPGIDSCDKCLDMQCGQELGDCLDDPVCFTGDPQDPGQYEQVTACVERLRTMQGVKRQDLRNCGLTVGTGTGWPPDGMADTTTNIINCMASGQTMIPMNNSWADPQNLSQPWPANSCAKLACTSMVQ